MSNLDLIDWRLVGFSALWILGLSIVLAAFSFADYRASQAETKTRTLDVLKSSGYRAAINAGLLLFCLGLLGSARAWWEGLLWLGLAAGFGYQAWQAWPRMAAWTARWHALGRWRR